MPAELLSKPTKLTKAEFELVKEHAQAGYDILKGIRFPWPVAEMALQHHERVDGTGYPNGLKGREMIIESRILAVADVVEAMASHRPYRVALGIQGPWRRSAPTAAPGTTRSGGRLRAPDQRGEIQADRIGSLGTGPVTSSPGTASIEQPMRGGCTAAIVIVSQLNTATLHVLYRAPASRSAP